jgi:hypothetical protein
MERHGGRQMTQPQGTWREDTTPGGTDAWRREAWLVREQATRQGLAPGQRPGTAAQRIRRMDSMYVTASQVARGPAPDAAATWPSGTDGGRGTCTPAQPTCSPLTLRWCRTPDGLSGVWERQEGRATPVAA